MARQRILRIGGLCFLGTLAVGCCPAPFPAIYVETTIHPDGSCDRMIWQPKEKFLPGDALKPEWNVRWKSVSDASGRSGTSASRAADDECLTKHLLDEAERVGLDANLLVGNPNTRFASRRRSCSPVLI
jgi:hypothetical protein